MATYLNFHQLECSPFEGHDSHQLVLATSSLRHAYAQIKAGLDEGSPRICLSGSSGIGKSSLARALPKLLASSARCVLVRECGSEWRRIKASIAKQLSLEGEKISRTSLKQIHYPAWTAPVLSRKRLFLRSENALVCLDMQPPKK